VAKCGVLVDVDEHDRVTNVRGDPEHALSAGYLCPKGRAIGRLHHHPDRLDTPAGGRGASRKEPGWDAVLDDLGTRLGAIVRDHGPDAVAAYGGNGGAQDNAGYGLLNKLTRQLGSRSWYTALTIDSPAKGLVAELMSGYSGLTAHVDVDCGLVLLIGTNPAVSHGHTSAMASPIVWLRDVARAGELWVLDPRRTETARVATRHLPVRPGNDHVVLAHLVRELLRDGADAAYLEAHGAGCDDLRAAVEPFDEASAATRAGLEPSELRALLSSVRAHRRLAVVTGTGATMAAPGNLTEWLAWALLAVTGSFEQPGGMWFNPGPGRGYETRTYTSRSGAPQPGPASRPELPRRWGQFPCSGLVDEIEAGNVRGLLVIGGNPLASFPEPGRVRRALESLDVLAVLEVMRNDLTDIATHVLPCAGDLERADVAMGAFPVIPAIFAQYSPAVVGVAAQRRPVWRILVELAERLGLDPLLPADVTTSDEAVLGALVGFDEHRPDISWGVVEDYHPSLGWVAERVLPEGRWRLAPAELVAQLARDADGAGPTNGLVIVPRRQLRHMNSALIDSGGGGARIDEPLLQIHPDDAARAGVGDGDEVEVRSAHGRVRARASLDLHMRVGVVSLPHGFVDTNVNALTSLSEQVDPLTGMVRLSGVPVTVAAVAAVVPV
jgi:anaerobic selenocysteine-containing dehydrogenase